MLNILLDNDQDEAELQLEINRLFGDPGLGRFVLTSEGRRLYYRVHYICNYYLWPAYRERAARRAKRWKERQLMGLPLVGGDCPNCGERYKKRTDGQNGVFFIHNYGRTEEGSRPGEYPVEPFQACYVEKDKLERKGVTSGR